MDRERGQPVKVGAVETDGEQGRLFRATGAAVARKDEPSSIGREARCEIVRIVRRKRGYPPQIPAARVHQIDTLTGRGVAAIGVEGDEGAVR